MNNNSNSRRTSTNHVNRHIRITNNSVCSADIPRQTRIILWPRNMDIKCKRNMHTHTKNKINNKRTANVNM